MKINTRCPFWCTRFVEGFFSSNTDFKRARRSKHDRFLEHSTTVLPFRVSETIVTSSLNFMARFHNYPRLFDPNPSKTKAYVGNAGTLVVVSLIVFRSAVYNTLWSRSSRSISRIRNQIKTPPRICTIYTAEASTISRALDLETKTTLKSP